MTVKKITRREFIRTAAVGTGVLVLGACSPVVPATAPPEAPESTQGESVEVPHVNKGGTVRVFWHPGHSYEAYAKAVEEFEKDHPGWKVEMELYQWP